MKTNIIIYAPTVGSCPKSGQHVPTPRPDEQEGQANLALFKNLIGSWSLKRWADISKDELNSVNLKY